MGTGREKRIGWCPSHLSPGEPPSQSWINVYPALWTSLNAITFTKMHLLSPGPWFLPVSSNDAQRLEVRWKASRDCDQCCLPSIPCASFLTWSGLSLWALPLCFVQLLLSLLPSSCCWAEQPLQFLNELVLSALRLCQILVNFLLTLKFLNWFYDFPARNLEVDPGEKSLLNWKCCQSRYIN